MVHLLDFEARARLVVRRFHAAIHPKVGRIQALAGKLHLAKQ